MRSEFLRGLTELAATDERIVLLTADLGFGSIEVFSERFPNRFINTGVAEQGMIGLATGLAESGFHPYCYSIASFSVARTFEFLRNGPIAHNLPVRLIGIGPGLDYSLDGMTHYALEDLTLLMNQPNVEIVAPRDGESAEQWGRLGSENPGLVYYRLARNVPNVESASVGEQLEPDVCIVALGDTATQGLEMFEVLASRDIKTDLIYQEVVSPVSMKELVQDLVAVKPKVVITLESHYIQGGFGSSLAVELMDAGWIGRVLRWGIDSPPLDSLGDYSFMLSRHSPSPVELLDLAASIVKSRSSS